MIKGRRRMPKQDKFKGISLVILGIAWIGLVYNFDALIHRPAVFGSKAILAFICGIILLVNGVRIFQRK